MPHPDLIPSIDTLSADDQARWHAVFTDVLAETADETKAALAAWGAVRKERVLEYYGMKSAGKPIVAGWGMLFTDPEHPDLDDQFFDEQTKTFLDLSGRALWYEHGQDVDYGVDPIGERVYEKAYKWGIWTEHKLYDDHPFYERTVREVENGELSLSSDSVAHYVARGYDEQTGRLGVWTIAGWSLTRNPAEPALGAVTFQQFASAVKAATEAREAQGQGSDAGKTQSRKPLHEDIPMKPELLNGLAEFLGVDPDVKAVKSSLDTLIEALTEVAATEDAGAEVPAEDKAEGEDSAAVEDVGAGLPDMAQLRAALGLGADAPSGEIIGRLQELMAMLSEQPEMKSYNFNGLAAAVGAAAKSTVPVDPALPKLTREQGQPGMKNVNINKGARKPGVLDFINDVKAGKAQSTQLGPTGGYILNQVISDELLPEMKEGLWMNDAGVKNYSLEGTQVLQIPKVTAGATASWVGEGQEIDDSELTYDIVTLVPKTVAARVIVPNQYLNRVSSDNESRTREDIMYRINRAISQAALFGTGGVVSGSNGAQPRGLLYTTGVTSTSLGANGGTPDLEDLTAMELRLREEDVEMSDSWRFVFSPRTKKTFQDLTDTTGNPLIRQSWRDGAESTLIGHRFIDTTQVPNNVTVGSSTDTSYIFLGDWQYLALGMSNQIEIQVNPYRLMHQLQTEIIAYTYVDIAVLYPEAFEVLTGVRA